GSRWPCWSPVAAGALRWRNGASATTGARAARSFRMDRSTPAPTTAADPGQLESARTDTTHGAGMRNMQQLIELRWYAIVGQMATIGFVHFALGIKLPLVTMLGIAGCLAAFNLACLVFWRPRQEVGDVALLAALLVDVAALSAQLYLSGGITNPFVFLYLLQ